VYEIVGNVIQEVFMKCLPAPGIPN